MENELAYRVKDSQGIHRGSFRYFRDAEDYAEVFLKGRGHKKFRIEVWSENMGQWILIKNQNGHNDAAYLGG